MPLRQYRCKLCEKSFELLQKMHESAPTVCTNCGACDSMETIFGKTNFKLVGGGWSKDLYSSVDSKK